MNRNRKLEALREVVRRDRAVLAIDLGEDKQVAVVMDHECRVLARKIVTAKAHQLAGLAVACEPAGHRWKALMGLADAAGHGFCCVQSLAVHRSRETDDCTPGKTGHRDAFLIGKLALRLECYLPERAGEARARLRHLGARRFALVADLTALRQQAGDLLPHRGQGRRRGGKAGHDVARCGIPGHDLWNADGGIRDGVSHLGSTPFVCRRVNLRYSELKAD